MLPGRQAAVRGLLASFSSSHNPLRPLRSARKTTLRPSGEKDGSRSSAVSRTASVSARASPPPAGSSHSCPRRSNTIVRPSEERSKPSSVPSLTRNETVSRVSRGAAQAETSTTAKSETRPWVRERTMGRRGAARFHDRQRAAGRDPKRPPRLAEELEHAVGGLTSIGKATCRRSACSPHSSNRHCVPSEERLPRVGAASRSGRVSALSKAGWPALFRLETW